MGIAKQIRIFSFRGHFRETACETQNEFSHATQHREIDCEKDPQFSVDVLQLQKTPFAKQQVSLLSFAEEH
jgi:hypothetical protein